ncbi:hypothetical protein SAMN04883147_103823 [Streptomyces sp. DpondAA-F4]|nr:hypothetical protein SAMN04883147_103823 [Streptomyces sp. DpondAA-F4]
MSGLGLGAAGIRKAVEEPAVGGGAARHGLDVSELRVSEPQTDGAGGAAAVARFEDQEPAAGADQGGSGAQELVECAVEGAGPGQRLGELVQRGEVGDPAGQPVLEEGARHGRNIRRGRGSLR